MENQQLVSLSRQYSSTPVGFGKIFLAQKNMTTLEQPLYSPDLAATDFHLFPRRDGSSLVLRNYECAGRAEKAFT